MAGGYLAAEVVSRTLTVLPHGLSRRALIDLEVPAKQSAGPVEADFHGALIPVQSLRGRHDANL